MRALVVIAALVLMGCDPDGDRLHCVTPLLDWRIYDGLGTHSCEDWATAEAIVAEELASITYDDRPRISLEGIGVYVRPTPSWDYYGLEVSGLAHCPAHNVEIGAAPLGETALTHEVMHILDDCATPNHSTWARDGVWSAIDRANARMPTHAGDRP
jgi:hypothetical protein